MDRTLEPEVMDSVDEAEAYDAMDHREPNRAFVDRLIELGARGRVLDIGCGPGHIPILLCERVADCTVVGVDLAATMLACAERRLAAAPPDVAGRIRFQLADAKRLPFEDGEFDVVCSNTILHHIPDPAPFVREAARVLRPGGVLLIRDLFRPPTPARALELVALHAGDATPAQQELLRASLHAALEPDELRELAAAVGVNAEVVVDSDRHMSLQRAAERAAEE